MTANTSCVAGTPSHTVFKNVILDAILSTNFCKYAVCDNMIFIVAYSFYTIFSSFI